MTVATTVSLVNAEEVRQQLQSIAPKMRRNTTRAIQAGAAPIVMDAQARAGQFSTRIPDAISARPKYAGRPGIYIRVDSAKAPHARGYEDVTGRGEVRHPVFGKWRPGVTYAKSRPYVAPAIRAGAPRVRSGIEQAISDALRV